MSRPLSLFQSYRQGENAATNNVGVMLRLLHQESAIAFEALWRELAGDTLAVGPQFTQQSRVGEGVPDLLITQAPFAIHVETKLGAGFSDAQLERHIQALSNLPIAAVGAKILVALGNHDGIGFAQRHAPVMSAAAEAGVTLVALSFEELLAKLRDVDATPDFAQLVNEFAVFLDYEGLLPRWRTRLTAIPCGKTLDEFRAGAYMCPDTGGAYSHQRARFFGAYSNKVVSMIARVKARVVLPADKSPPYADWREEGDSEESLIAEAHRTIAASSRARRDEAEHTSLQVFLLDTRYPTSFEKDSLGGAQNKRYFNAIAQPNESAPGLADRLRGRKWSEFAD